VIHQQIVHAWCPASTLSSCLLISLALVVVPALLMSSWKHKLAKLDLVDCFLVSGVAFETQLELRCASRPSMTLSPLWC